MPTSNRVVAHLRWRRERLREFYRGRLFDLAGRHREVIRTRDRHGNSYLVLTRDPVLARAMYVHGAFDTAKIDNTLLLLAEHGVNFASVLDIGANVGTTTLELLARRPDLWIECFEPEPFNYRMLTTNLARNAKGRARTHQLALSNVDGSLTFELSPEHPGDHRVRAKTEDPGALDEAARETIIVSARQLDQLPLGTDHTTLACIDVQGHEWEVLAGGAASLRGPMTLEFWPYALARNGRLEDLIERLSDMGRSMIDITFDPTPTDVSILKRQGQNHDPDYARELLILP